MKHLLFLFGILFVGTLSLGHLAIAAGQCGHTKPVTGCMFTIKDLEREQTKLNEVDDSIDLKASLKSLFKNVNGKQLVYNHVIAGRYTLKIHMTSTKVNVLLNGRPAKDTEMCFEVCPGKNKITWYNEERGIFKKIKDGLSVGGYEFKIEKN